MKSPAAQPTTSPVSQRIGRWLLEEPGREEPASGKGKGPRVPEGAHSGGGHQHAWWKVMCLTGVDYFSTLGYQPGIAALAAGLVSPVATIVLVLLTLFGALPVYRRVARESPHGQGSIAMLEKLLPRWRGKLIVLVLLGFVATDFIITITLSAADASAHVLENSFAPGFLHGQQILVTLVLVALLGAVFLRGFKEAIGIAVVLVAAYLTLNLVVVAVALQHVVSQPHVVADWQSALTTSHGSPWMVVGIALLVFPKLALGLSGFETGVSMMPLVAGEESDSAQEPTVRTKNTQRLLVTAALIMSAFLITTSFATTLLIPQAAFQDGGKASGRALAYLAHQYLGNGFGTVYDISTIAILWFAGASAMAGLLNIVPRYLPRYGMAPDWARMVRPLVLVFMAIAVVITILFRADVNAQGGAYATGVLVLISSAALAVTLSARRRGARTATIGFGLVFTVFLYTTAANIIERPEGVKIASFFIIAIVTTSLISRATRSTELRVTSVDFDEVAQALVEEEARSRQFRIIANEPDERDQLEYLEKDVLERQDHNLPDDAPVLFLEVTVVDASEFETALKVTGEVRHGFKILRVESPTVPNAIAAVLLAIRDQSGVIPHIYFEWMEGNPIAALLRYLVFGGGDVPPLTREVLRRAEPNRERRPAVHVG